MTETTQKAQAQLLDEYVTECPGGTLFGATFAGRRLVLASGAYLLRIGPTSRRVVDRLETFPAPGGLAFDGYCLWQCSQGVLQALDVRTGFVVQSTPLELSDVTGLECLEGDLLLLSSAGRRLTRIHVASRGLACRVIVVGEVATDAPLRGLGWVAGELWSATDGGLVRIDPTTAETLEQVQLPPSVAVCDLAANAFGRFWCVDGASSTVRVVEHPTRTGDGQRSHPQAPPSARAKDASASQPSAEVATEQSRAGGAPVDAYALAEACFDRILVPIDFSAASRDALAMAVFLQDHLGSQIHLLNLTQQGANAEFLAGAGGSVGYGDLTSDARGELVRFVENLYPGGGSRVVPHARVGGNLVVAIRAVAKEVGATLVLLPGAGPAHRARIEVPVMVLPTR